MRAEDLGNGPSSETSNSLAEDINQYRLEQGLQAIPVSVSLTKVAQAHVADSEQNSFSNGCNLHSWSDQGDWTPCCYTNDHAQAQCMWDKPREISGGVYSGNGFEISAYNSRMITPQGALEGWQGSSGHHNVILNRDIWADSNWQAMGAAVSTHYAVVWFGMESDPAGSP
ncbi:MAG: CAP domain-containing protein [Candidatus Latescibacteria bacterium]|nr:CAP domain-containing protein [Candidatus Latescibacterota bacterium]